MVKRVLIGVVVKNNNERKEEQEMVERSGQKGWPKDVVYKGSDQTEWSNGVVTGILTKSGQKKKSKGVVKTGCRKDGQWAVEKEWSKRVCERERERERERADGIVERSREKEWSTQWSKENS